jgi:glycosyltransferase involved in cell wall biosynthesis
MKKKKIFFVIPHMTVGGSERVLSTILKFLDRKRFAPTLIVYGKRFSYDIPKDVKIVDLKMDGSGANELKKAWYFVKRIRKIKHIIDSERPDIVFTMLAGPIPIISAILSGHKPLTVVRQTTHVSTGLHGFRGNLHKLFVRLFYPKADLIIAPSHDVKKDLSENFGVSEKMIRVIHNPIDLDYIRKNSREKVKRGVFSGRYPVIITVGRLNEKKGIRYLLEAFHMLRKEKKAKLAILGDGPDRDTFAKLSRELKIQDDVSFMGFEKNPFKYVSKASIFAFPSLYEGFPNVLIESMACGTPVVSADCHSGPAEIIDNNKYGLLVPVKDSKALYRAMKRLLDDTPLREGLSEAGKKRAADFDVRIIMKKYEDLLLKGS